MSTDTDLEEAYKMGNTTSHIEGLRAVAKVAVAGSYPSRVGPIVPKAPTVPTPSPLPPKPTVGLATTTTP